MALMVSGPLLVAAACSSGHSSTSSPATGSQPATVRVTYTATSRSSSAGPVTITYTDPLDAAQVSEPGKAGWIYTYPQVPAGKSVALQIRVTGPDPSRNSCAIRIDGHKVTSQSGQGSQAPGAAVICTYTLGPAHT